jgi:hypothetical protein
MGKYITVTRTFTYDLDKIKQDYSELNRGGDETITDDEVLELVKEWAYEDLSSRPTRHDINWTMSDDQGAFEPFDMPL